MNRYAAVLALLKKAYALARPYGRRRLAVVFFWVFAQGMMQVVGVTSIFPFLAIAADPGRIRDSKLGQQFQAALSAVDDRQLLIFSGLLAIALLLVSNALNLFSEVARTRYSHQFGHWLRMRLLRQIISQPYAFFLQVNSGILLKKVAADVSLYIQGVLLPLLDSMSRLFTIILLLSVVFLVNPEIALYAGTGLGGFYVLVFLYLNRRLAAVSSGMNKAERMTWIEGSQLLGGIKPVKVHRAEHYFMSRFARHSYEQARLQSWVPVYSNGPRYLVEPLAFGGLVSIVLVMAVQGRAFSAILPTLGVLALAGYRLIPAMQLLYGQLAQLATMTHHLDEIYEEFAAAERQKTDTREIVRPPNALQWEQSLTLEKVTFAYAGAPAPVLQDITLTIPKCSCVAFVGTTGCGKSTLLDLLLGLHRPTSGRILVDGKELSGEDIAAWQVGIGYVPQDIFLLDDTLAANIAFGVPAEERSLERLREVCAIAQILFFIENELPNGFETRVGERGVRLSGGQRQRIGLARAMYHRPQLLILDEATSALDIATEAGVMEAIESLKGKLTMILVAHRLSTIQGCERVFDLGAREIAEHAAS